MIRLILILVLCCAATGSAAGCKGTDLRQRLTPQYQSRLKTEIAKVPFAYGNHWIARKGSRSIHVVGTQHFGDSRMRSVMRNLAAIIAGADAVLLEVTRAQMDAFWSNLHKTPHLVMITKGPTIPDMLPAQDWQRLLAALRGTGLSPEEAAVLQPWVLSFYLSKSGCGGRGIASYAGLDDRIERTAVRNRVPIGGLETTGTGMRTLARQPVRDQLRLLQYDLRSNLNYDDQVVTLSEAYFEEALAEARIVQEWTLYRDLDVPRSEIVRLLRQFDALIIDRRNRAWVPVIERTRGDRLVVAVGAAHLSGRAGLLNLLRARGYRLERAPF